MHRYGDPDDDLQDDALGLASTYPRPGWVVLDAIRERSFTGEVACRTTPPVTIWADRGTIYLAERDSDPSLGSRLVEAGTLTDDELVAGAVMVGDVEHLGRLFDRAPSVDRHAVLVATQLMTEECIGWLAGQRVYGAIVIPYRHHPSGAHHWTGQSPPPLPPPAPPAPPAPLAAPQPTPGATVGSESSSAALPAPAPKAPPANLPAPFPAPTSPLLPAPAGPTIPPASEPAPTPATASHVPDVDIPRGSLSIGPLRLPGMGTAAPVEQRTPSTELGPGDVIDWDDPGWLDKPLTGEPTLGLIRPLPVPGTWGRTDGVGRPSTTATPGPGPADTISTDPVAWADSPADSRHQVVAASRSTVVASAPSDATETADRFEVIWPSGEVDEQFGGQMLEPFPDPDLDRAGPTARVVRDGVRRGAAAEAVRVGHLVEDDVTSALGAGVADIEEFLAGHADPDTEPGTDVAADDELMLAVRQAAAQIEAGALAQPDRRIGPRSGLVIGVSTGPAQLKRPGRVALRDTGELPATPAGHMARPDPAARSVFDEVPPTAAEEPAQPEPAVHDGTDGERVTALRRLIGSLRRR